MVMTETREALIRTDPANVEVIARYLPNNYTIVGADSTGVTIRGIDHYGWTLDGYVLPRLASGMYFGEEAHPAGDCNDMGCKYHGVSASNRRQSEFYAKNDRTVEATS
jgi:hypothetical protein